MDLKMELMESSRREGLFHDFRVGYIGRNEMHGDQGVPSGCNAAVTSTEQFIFLHRIVSSFNSHLHAAIFRSPRFHIYSRCQCDFSFVHPADRQNLVCISLP